jgi:predicted 2-oxoglutarate/Fe(II)-dependent dioxygenase YbiX
MANVDDETRDLAVQRLAALSGTLGKHFDLPLESCQRPQFLVYGEGDFFGAHKDGSDDDASVRSPTGSATRSRPGSSEARGSQIGQSELG